LSLFFWPSLSSLIEPIGHHRRRYIQPSKGKRERKRKRAQDRKAGEEEKKTPTTPPLPEISKQIDVGLPSISRTLQRLASAANIETSHGENSLGEKLVQDNSPVYSVVFVAKHGQPTTFHCHFPQMVIAASKNACCKEPIRLVGLSEPCADRLSAALGMPRVSAIALHDDAPQAKALVEYVREHVPPASSTWLFPGNQHCPGYLATDIKAIETIHRDSKRANTNGKG